MKRLAVSATMILLSGSQLLTTPSFAERTIIIPDDPYGMFEPNHSVGRGKTASAAADALHSAAAWINELGVRKMVSQLVSVENKTIADLFARTGQDGILYRVDIQRAEGEIPFYSVVNRSIQRVGAGSSPLAINLAVNQKDQLRPAPSPGASVDLEKSYFIWFTKQGTDIVAQDIPAKVLISATARNFADQKLLQATNDSNKGLALEASVRYLENSATGKALQRRLADWKAKQDENVRQRAHINRHLVREMAKAKKAQQTAAIFTLISGAMTLASQAVAYKNALGDDAPKDAIENAKSVADLQRIAKDVEATARNNIKTLIIEYNGTVDQTNGLKSEYIEILRETKYPIGQVPELFINY